MKFTKFKQLTLLIATMLCLASSPAWSESQEINKSFAVKPGGTLSIETDSGAIQIETWDQKKIEIVVTKRARNKSRMDAFIITINNKGNNVTILGESENNNRVSVNYVLKLPKKFNLDLETGGGSIQVGDIQGKVKVDTKGGSIRFGNVDGDLDINTSGGSIKLGKISGTSSIDTAGGSISVEQGGTEVVAESSGGSIKVGPSNGKVDVKTAGGSITVGVAKGDVKAKTAGGSIKVAGSNGRVKVKTAGGSIVVGSSNGPVEAKTAGGSIKIRKAHGFIEAKTAGGSIEAEMTLADNKADTHVTLKSAGGSITLYLPKKLAATVEAELNITRSAKRDYRIYSDFPLSIKGEKSDTVTADGKLNGGGDKISLETTNGNIYIKMIK